MRRCAYSVVMTRHPIITRTRMRDCGVNPACASHSNSAPPPRSSCPPSNWPNRASEDAAAHWLACVPIRIKRLAMLCRRPGGASRPRRTLAPLRVQCVAQIRGCRCSGANPLLAHVAGDPFDCPGDGQRHSIQARGSSSRPLTGLAAAVDTHAKQRARSNGWCSLRMW